VVWEAGVAGQLDSKPLGLVSGGSSVKKCMRVCVRVCVCVWMGGGVRLGAAVVVRCYVP
jgi:hypothetical protein